MCAGKVSKKASKPTPKANLPNSAILGFVESA